MIIIKRVIAQVAENYLSLILIIFLLPGCASSNVQKVVSEAYTLKRHSSVNNTSYLHLSFFDYEDSTKIPAGYRINGIVFGKEINVKNNTISVLPGNYNIEAVFVGKKLTTAKVNISKGDSTVVKMYLKDSTEPLY